MYLSIMCDNHAAIRVSAAPAVDEAVHDAAVERPQHAAAASVPRTIGRVVELVDVGLVQQEPVQASPAFGETLRDLRVRQIEAAREENASRPRAATEKNIRPSSAAWDRCGAACGAPSGGETVTTARAGGGRKAGARKAENRLVPPSAGGTPTNPATRRRRPAARAARSCCAGPRAGRCHACASAVPCVTSCSGTCAAP